MVKTLRIAIHDRVGGFSAKWIEYCKEHSIDFEIVNAYDSGIIEKLRNFDAFLWHMNHENPTDLMMARSVLLSAEQMGLAVFPNHATNWHFDDKLAQKYLLESIGAPLAPTEVFFDKNTAMDWLSQAELPVVAKLTRGAGSYNVKLLKTLAEARSYCERMFGRGINPAPQYFDDSITKVKNIKSFASFIDKLKRAPKIIARRRKTKKRMACEKGYVLFQKFIHGNSCDFRIKVVGDIAWGFRRMVRENDFRASGSGNLDFDYHRIPGEMIRIAFNTADKLKMQSVAFDFVLQNNVSPLIVELSYGFGIDEGESEGYWDRNFQYHKKRFMPTDVILETILKNIV